MENKIRYQFLVLLFSYVFLLVTYILLHVSIVYLYTGKICYDVNEIRYVYLCILLLFSKVNFLFSFVNMLLYNMYTCSFTSIYVHLPVLHYPQSISNLQYLSTVLIPTCTINRTVCYT